MNRQVLETNLRALDARTQNVGNEIQNARQRCAGYRGQAEKLEEAANRMFQLASMEEDEEKSAHDLAMGSAYMAQAEQNYAMADEIEGQLSGMEGELLGLKEQYVMYMEEGQRNLQSLNIAVGQLMGASGSRYGRDGVKAALGEARGQITYNQNLVNGCRQRIGWIEGILSESGDPYQKTYRLHR